MGRAGVRASAAVGELLRRKRKEMQLTLREVSERMSEKGEPLPISTLARIEQGKLDPGVRRLHLLLRLYRIPPHLVTDLVELETLAIEHPPKADLDTLYRQGVELWKKGDIARGLSYLLAVREYVTDDEESRIVRQKATLGFAVVARNLGKFKLAKQILDELLLEPPDPSLNVNTLVLGASLWRGLGSIEAALAFVRHAAERVDPDDHRQSAWVAHQEAKVLMDAGRTEEAANALDRGIRFYELQGDTYGHVRALILRERIQEATGEAEAAFATIAKALRIAAEQGLEKLANSARIEHGRLLFKQGRAEEGLALLNEGLGKAILLGDRNSEFHAHYHLWKAHLITGDAERAQLAFDTARYLVRHIDDLSPEADEIRELSSD